MVINIRQAAMGKLDLIGVAAMVYVLLIGSILLAVLYNLESW